MLMSGTRTEAILVMLLVPKNTLRPKAAAMTAPRMHGSTKMERLFSLDGTPVERRGLNDSLTILC